MMRFSQRARAPMIPASFDLAPASSRARSAGSDRAFMRSGTGRANISRHPGRLSRMAPGSKQSRIFMVWGNVSATTVAPRSAARRRRRELVLETVGIERGDAEHVPVGGAVGQQRQRRHEVDLVLAEPVETSRHDELERRARMRGQDAAQRLELRPRRGARRHRHAVPVVVGGRLRRREPESTLFERAGQHRRHRPHLVVGGGWRRRRPRPSPTRRTAEWPTRNPAFTATEPSSRPNHSPNEVHDQSRCSSAAMGMPSTRAIMRARYSRVLGAGGASENPQLPPITVVTPCSGEGLAVGSHDSWAS